ncbi:MAG TPA: ROK family protein [Myxococcaceae bacterium]|nr:ROK family protein [Myxococcaceae bacterium]
MAYLGIDLGGTYARAAVVDPAGSILAAAKIALQDRTPAGVVDAIAVAAQEALAAARRAVLGVGVGVAAQLEGDTGVVAVSPNLQWRDVPFGELLSRKLGRPVRVVNDLAAAAWGELNVGAGRGTRDLFVVFVGSGVGSAIVAGGRLVRGANGVAGEFGHVKVIPDGRLCGCGERGCLEAYVGGHNLIAQMQEAIDAGRPTTLLARAKGNLALLTPVVLEDAALAGDEVAQEIYDRATSHLGLGIANMVTVLNPAMLVIGGGVLMHCPGMRKAIADSVQRHASWVSRRAVKVTQAALGDESGLIGAALLAAEA